MRVDCRPFTTGCHGCGGPLPKGRRAWCSNECERDVISNHVWGVARAAALKRDGYRCQDCGATESKIERRQTVNQYPWYGQRPGPLEVNHIEPLNGVRPSVSCVHHLENLITLCHECHLKVTARQRAAGMINTRPRRKPRRKPRRGSRHVWKGGDKCHRCHAGRLSYRAKSGCRGRPLWP